MLTASSRAGERARIEQAIAQDAQLAQRVAQQRALRDRLRGAYSGVLHEAVPQRLAQAVKLGAPAGPAQVIDLARVRAERSRRVSGQRQREGAPPQHRRQPGGGTDGRCADSAPGRSGRRDGVP
jgi:anti-sigma factor RsiW